MREKKFRVFDKEYDVPKMVYSDEYESLSVYVSIHGLDENPELLHS